jgi:hypothetical protein
MKIFEMNKIVFVSFFLFTSLLTAQVKEDAETKKAKVNSYKFQTGELSQMKDLDLSILESYFEGNEPDDSVTIEIVYKKSPKTDLLLRNWYDLYMASPEKKDQPSFKQALWETEIMQYVLGPEYNFRINFPCFKGKNSLVKIVHGRGREFRNAVGCKSLRTEKGWRNFDYRRISIRLRKKLRKLMFFI